MEVLLLWEKAGADVYAKTDKVTAQAKCWGGYTVGRGLVVAFSATVLHACHDGISYIIVGTTIVHRTVATKVCLAALPFNLLDCKSDTIDYNQLVACDVYFDELWLQRLAVKLLLSIDLHVRDLCYSRPHPIDCPFSILSLSIH